MGIVILVLFPPNEGVLGVVHAVLRDSQELRIRAEFFHCQHVDWISGRSSSGSYCGHDGFVVANEVDDARQGNWRRLCSRAIWIVGGRTGGVCGLRSLALNDPPQLLDNGLGVRAQELSLVLRDDRQRPFRDVVENS